MNNIYKKQKNAPAPSEKFAVCSLICGIIGVVLSLFYLPVSLLIGGNYPAGLICGAGGIVLALWPGMQIPAPQNPSAQGHCRNPFKRFCYYADLFLFLSADPVLRSAARSGKRPSDQSISLPASAANDGAASGEYTGSLEY